MAIAKKLPTAQISIRRPTSDTSQQTKREITISHLIIFPNPRSANLTASGICALEISLKTLEFEPAAQAARKAIARSESTENSSIPSLHRIISAVGVDSHSQELWIAIGTLLMRFDKEGLRLSSFRIFLPRGGAPGAISNPGGS